MLGATGGYWRRGRAQFGKEKVMEVAEDAFKVVVGSTRSCWRMGRAYLGALRIRSLQSMVQQIGTGE
jgi:hypothetical protein